MSHPYPHLSVLCAEVLRFFSDKHLRVYLDGTLGAGGHAQAVLEAHPEIEIFLAIDQDPDAMQIAKERLKPWEGKLRLIQGNFARLREHLAGLPQVDGMLFDLGVSSMQLDRPEKGFSFMREGPLDMRMDPHESLTASLVVNTWSERELGRVFRDYGEEKRWRLAAKAIVAAREKKPIETTRELAEVLKPAFPYHKCKPGLHPLTLVFQALRICVNRELEVLEEMLPTAIAALAPGGRLGVISFHSLEDRIVKNALRFAADDKEVTSGIGGVFLDKEPQVKLLTRKPVVPSESEIGQNPRSRSAKLRFIEKL
jgi:16S rRNA (cytosine1402-N4)-methyltransferase